MTSASRLRRRVRAVLVPLLAMVITHLAAPASLSAQPTGTVRGTVRNQSGAYLEGAVVRVEGTALEAMTGREGQFVITGVSTGAQVVVVRYIGYAVARANVAVDASRRTELELTMTPSLETVTTIGQVAGQAAALNIQRSSDNLKTVVSREALGLVQEGNIGDALLRLPGIIVETRAGVNRTATIRGLAPQYNSVTVDGLPITNVDGNRDVALDEFPYATLSRVEVTKALTPDLPGDGIGGSLNLVTRTAFDAPGRTLAFNAGGTSNARGNTVNQQLELVYGDRLGADRKFGYLFTGSYFRDLRGYDGSDITYSTAGTNPYVLTTNNVYARGEEKRRTGLGFNVGYRPNTNSTVYAKAIYSDDYRWLDQKGTTWRPTTSQVDNITFYREPKNVFQMYIAGGTTRVGGWDTDLRASHSRADKTYPATMQITTRVSNVAMTADVSDPRFPSFTVTNGVDLGNKALQRLVNVDQTQVPRNEHETTFDLSSRRRFAVAGLPVSLKFGARRSDKHAQQAQPIYARYTLSAANSASITPTLTRDVSTPDFLPAANGRARLLPYFPDYTKWLTSVRNGTGTFLVSEPFSTQGRANSDFGIDEVVTAGFGMATVDVGTLRVIGGARVEHTENVGRANLVRTATVGGVTSVTAIEPKNSKGSYDNVLPSLHLRYQPVEPLVLRGSFTTGMARPAAGDLIPSAQVNAQLNPPTIVVGNPDLKPATAKNYDLAAEYAVGELGVLSVSGFRKNIESFVFSERTRLTSGDFAGYDEQRRVNSLGGRSEGLELAWVQRFNMLPGLLSGLGVESNYSVIRSNARYPNRTEKLPLTGPAREVLNLIGFYNLKGFELRVSHVQRSARLSAVGATLAQDRYFAPDKLVDLTFSYGARRFGSVFANVRNATNQPTVEFVGSRDHPVSTTYYGRQFNFGVRYGM
jgi:TonB-dependent receptor